MIQIAAAILAGIMMVGAALRGLRPRARLVERFYSAATGGWSALGAAIYYPTLYGRFAPVGWIHNHLLVTVFGFGLIMLGVYGASLMIGDK
jgi:hypothetical protein